MSYILIFIVAACNIISVTAFRLGVARAGGISPADLAHPVIIVTKIATTPLLLGGLCTSCVTTVVWLMTLSRVPANVAVPLMNGVYYLLLLVISTLILGEGLSPRTVGGTILILGATVLLTR